MIWYVVFPQNLHCLQAALQDTRIPLVEVGATENPDEEPELELDDDPAHATQLDTSNVPVIVTVSQVGPLPPSIYNLPACHALYTAAWADLQKCQKR